MPLVFDAGGLIAIERNRRDVVVLVKHYRAAQEELVVPAGALAQAWRDGATQTRLASFLNRRDVIVTPLTEPLARATGELCRRRGTTDVVDASVVLVARQHRASVLTSDPDDIARLDPGADIIAC